MIESLKFHMQPLRCFNLGRKATGLVVSLSEQNPTQWAREHGNLYSSYLNLKKLGVIFLFPMFPGFSLHGWISVLFEVVLGTLMIIDVWVLQRPITGDVHVLYVRRFQTGVHDFMNDAGGPKALELRYLLTFTSLSLLLNPWLRSGWLGTGRSVAKDEEGWALLSRWTWGQPRTSDHLLLSLFMP